MPKKSLIQKERRLVCWFPILRRVFPTSSCQGFAKNFPQGERNRERKRGRKFWLLSLQTRTAQLPKFSQKQVIQLSSQTMALPVLELKILQQIAIPHWSRGFLTMTIALRDDETFTFYVDASLISILICREQNNLIRS